MKTIKDFIIRNWKIMAAYVASLYGTTFTTIWGILILTDEVWASERLEGLICLTMVPAMTWGVRTLKAYWIAKALSRSRDLVVVEPADKAA